jgi:hypothetical protein
MGKLRRTILTTTEAAAPRGKVLRLRLRLTLDLVITVAIAVFALASSIAYQVVCWRATRSQRP